MSDRMNQDQKPHDVPARGTASSRCASSATLAATAPILSPTLSSAFTMNVFSPEKTEVYFPDARPGPGTGMTFFLIVLSLLLVAMVARGHQVETINSFSITNYTG